MCAEKRKTKCLSVCEQFRFTSSRVPDNCEGAKLVGLGEPETATCKSIRADGGGQCWFATVFYLLTGKKRVGYQFNQSINLSLEMV